MQLVLSPAFSRKLKRLIRRNPQIREQVERVLERLNEDPFHPSLNTHKLKGKFSDRWSCSIDYSDRILFRFVENSDSGEIELLLLTIGSHDDVY
ncbi:type II toxin-antitoxin system YafQ family toxin [Phormidesmis sp. 146-12]